MTAHDRGSGRDEQDSEASPDTRSEPFRPVPPEVVERYDEMVRAHVSRSSEPRLNWRGVGLLVLCVSLVLTVLMTPRFSPAFLTVTVLCATAYAVLLRALANWAGRPFA